MKISPTNSQRGIALIMVMAVIFVLGIMAGGFAYSMKVEMKLARNYVSEAEMEWLGRSGVELARYVLAQQMNIPNQQAFDSLNQKWAGGIGETNELLADIFLDNNQLGSGSFSIKIVDCERKLNINLADIPDLQRAFGLIGLEPMDYAAAVDSILDWRDPDENTRLNGAESDYYEGLNPPYPSKNGPFDDLSELLLVRGVTPEMYWGGAGSNELTRVVAPALSSSASGTLGFVDKTMFQGGLVDLFTCLSAGQINVNTASAAALQMIPGIDANAAQEIVRARAGPDGVEGDEDDAPFRNPQEMVMNVPGLNKGLMAGMQRYCAVRSSTFEVHVLAKIGNYQREYVALLRRNTPRDVPILYFHGK